MSVLLSTLFGFLGSQIPHIWKYFQDIRDKEHELAIMDRQVEMSKLHHEERLEEINMPLEMGKLEAIYNTKTNIPSVDALNGSVRPIIALGLFILYCIMQLAYGVIFVIDPNIPSYIKLDELLSDEDYSFLGVVIGYYFGSRKSS